MSKINNFTKLFFVLSILIISSFCYAQSPININDTTIVFKDVQGKVMMKDSVLAFMSKGRFGMKSKPLVGGKMEITLYRKTEGEYKQESMLRMKNISKLEGTTFPAFKLKDISGNQITQDSLKGQVTVLNFWFIGCKPCVNEMPDLNKLTEKYKSVNFIAFTFEDKEQVKKFLLDHEFKYKHIPNSRELINVLGISSFPTHLILDKNGVVIGVELGASQNISMQLESQIDKALQKP